VRHPREVFLLQPAELVLCLGGCQRAFRRLRQHQPQLDQVQGRRQDVGRHVLGHESLLRRAECQLGIEVPHAGDRGHGNESACDQRNDLGAHAHAGDRTEVGGLLNHG
jgi:hypothetical protein